MADVKVGMIPYGVRADGSYGTLLDTNGKSLVSVCEILNTLPDVSAASNFVGRLVFSISDRNIFVWNNSSGAEWISLQPTLVTTGTTDPSATPTPVLGALYYNTVSQVLYIWSGTSWDGVGGQRGAGVLWRFYTGDGATSLFDTGATTLPPVEFVQVFVNGVAMSPGTSSTRDYFMIGNQVQLNSVPASGAKVAIRTLTFITATRNSKFIGSRYVADGTTNQFSTGVMQIDPNQIFVWIDGVAQTPNLGNGVGTYDFNVVTQDLKVTSLTSVGTTCSVTTEAPHNLTVGKNATISGALETAYNGTFVVTSVLSSNVFKYTAATTPTSSTATPNPTITFGPATTNDYIQFVNSSGVATPPGAGSVIQIKAVDNVVAGNLVGEANDGVMVGSGNGVHIYAGKSGVDLQFKTVSALSNRIQLTETASDIYIDAKSDSIITYVAWNGSPATYIVQPTDSYIGVKNSQGIPVAVDISTNIALNSSNTGRKLTITDEAGNASVNPISIVPNPASSIEGLPAGTAFVINTNYGSVTMVLDGTNWKLTSNVSDNNRNRWAGYSTGAPNVYQLNLTGALDAPQAGMTFRFRAHQTNTGGASAIVAGVTVPIRKNNGVALAASDILQDYYYQLLYDGTFMIKL